MFNTRIVKQISSSYFWTYRQRHITFAWSFVRAHMKYTILLTSRLTATKNLVLKITREHLYHITALQPDMHYNEITFLAWMFVTTVFFAVHASCSKISHEINFKGFYVERSRKIDELKWWKGIFGGFIRCQAGV